jgi:hypothetical protein
MVSSQRPLAAEPDEVSIVSGERQQLGWSSRDSVTDPYCAAPRQPGAVAAVVGI